MTPDRKRFPVLLDQSELDVARLRLHPLAAPGWLNRLARMLKVLLPC
ncbi:hypothetical protein [Tropicibacter alexandrii]|nr:hypothetical protein [Tropicibacter alexandrii]